MRDTHPGEHAPFPPVGGKSHATPRNAGKGHRISHCTRRPPGKESQKNQLNCFDSLHCNPAERVLQYRIEQLSACCGRFQTPRRFIPIVTNLFQRCNAAPTIGTCSFGVDIPNYACHPCVVLKISRGHPGRPRRVKAPPEGRAVDGCGRAGGGYERGSDAVRKRTARRQQLANGMGMGSASSAVIAPRCIVRRYDDRRGPGLHGRRHPLQNGAMTGLVLDAAARMGRGVPDLAVAGKRRGPAECGATDRGDGVQGDGVAGRVSAARCSPGGSPDDGLTRRGTARRRRCGCGSVGARRASSHRWIPSVPRGGRPHPGRIPGADPDQQRLIRVGLSKRHAYAKPFLLSYCGKIMEPPTPCRFSSALRRQPCELGNAKVFNAVRASYVCRMDKRRLFYKNSIKL